MRHEDYLAAVERLRRVASGDLANLVYLGPSGPQEKICDMLIIYDAEHDPTPASVEWLKGLSKMPCHVEYAFRLSGTEIAFIAHCGDVKLTNPTRGDVLTLLRVFRERKV